MNKLKTKNKPLQGTKLALAITAAMMGSFAGQVQAGTCGPNSPSSCTGAANAATDTTQSPAQAGGDLTVSTAAGFGIDTRTNSGNAITLSSVGANNISFSDANASQISGDENGIAIVNNGTGTTSITTNGAIFGKNGSGISIDNGNTSTGVSVSITGGSVTGKYSGIRVNSDSTSTAPITITSSAGTTINATNKYNGISISSEQQPSILNISGDVTAVHDGIRVVLNNPAVPAHTVITASGNITTDRDGIDVYHNDGAASNISITTSGVIRTRNVGIKARLKDNEGNTTIVSNGAITSTNSTGISAWSEFGDSQNITVNGTITANQNGVRTYSDYINSPTITINAPIIAGWNGIDSESSGGDISVDVNASITAGAVGINTETNTGEMSTITLNLGAVVTGGISNNEGDSTIIVNTGASVIGDIVLGKGSDSLTFAGGDFSGVTLFDGGDDTGVADTFIDTLIFQGSSGTIPAANVTNWESIVVDTNSTVNFTGSLDTGLLDNPNGTVTTQDGTAGDTLSVTGNFSGGGTLTLEAELGAGGAADRFVINGVANAGNTVLNIVNVGGAGSQTAGDGILVVQVDNPSVGTFSLAAPIRVGDYVYTLVQVGNSWYLQSQLASENIPTLSEWGQIILVVLLGLFGMFGFRRRSR